MKVLSVNSLAKQSLKVGTILFNRLMKRPLKKLSVIIGQVLYKLRVFRHISKFYVYLIYSVIYISNLFFNIEL